MSELQIFVLYNNESIKLNDVLKYPVLYREARLRLNTLKEMLRFQDVDGLINSGKDILKKKESKLESDPAWTPTDKEKKAVQKAQKEWENKTDSLEAQIFEGGGAKAVLLHLWHYKDAKYKELMSAKSRVLDASKSFAELIWPVDMRTWPDGADRKAKWSREKNSPPPSSKRAPADEGPGDPKRPRIQLQQSAPEEISAPLIKKSVKLEDFCRVVMKFAAENEEKMGKPARAPQIVVDLQRSDPEALIFHGLGRVTFTFQKHTPLRLAQFEVNQKAAVQDLMGRKITLGRICDFIKQHLQLETHLLLQLYPGASKPVIFIRSVIDARVDIDMQVFMAMVDERCCQDIP